MEHRLEPINRIESNRIFVVTLLADTLIEAQRYESLSFAHSADHHNRSALSLGVLWTWPLPPLLFTIYK